jgi:cytochrome b561
MTGAGQRFTVLQRFLHWLMAVCILAMLFIGVGMNSTVAPRYVPLLATRRHSRSRRGGSDES